MQCYFTNILTFTCYMVCENATQRSLGATENALFELDFTCNFVEHKKEQEKWTLA